MKNTECAKRKFNVKTNGMIALVAACISSAVLALPSNYSSTAVGKIPPAVPLPEGLILANGVSGSPRAHFMVFSNNNGMNNFAKRLMIAHCDFTHTGDEARIAVQLNYGPPISETLEGRAVASYPNSAYLEPRVSCSKIDTKNNHTDGTSYGLTVGFSTRPEGFRCPGNKTALGYDCELTFDDTDKSHWNNNLKVMGSDHSDIYGQYMLRTFDTKGNALFYYAPPILIRN